MSPVRVSQSLFNVNKMKEMAQMRQSSAVTRNSRTNDKLASDAQSLGKKPANKDPNAKN